MTPQETLIHNEKIKLTANFLSRIGLMLAFVGLLIPLFGHALWSPMMFGGGCLVIVGFGLNVYAFWYFKRIIMGPTG